jgi:cell division protein FtsW
LAYTLIKGTVIAGANASRWIQVPFIGYISNIYIGCNGVIYFVARYLSKTRTVPITFKSSIWELWLPVAYVTIYSSRKFLHNINFFNGIDVGFHWKYPLRYIGIVVGSGIVFLTFFILIAKAFPDAFPNRVDTWISRIDNFTSDKP